MAPTKQAGPRTDPGAPQIAGLRVLGRNRHFPFPEEYYAGSRVTIGRTRQRHLRIEHSSVSREHCAVSRLEDGRSRLKEWNSTNGIYIASRGKYSCYEKVTSEILEFGMFIRLGDVTLIPVDTRGVCPILAATFREFFIGVVEAYGNPSAAAEKVGLSRQTLARAVKKAETLEAVEASA